MERRRSKPRPQARRAPPTYPIPKPLYQQPLLPTPTLRRSRFTNRSFSNNRAILSGLTIPKTLNVKLAYTKEFRADCTVTTGTWSDIYHPSGTRTFPVSGTTASIVFLGSHCCTPLFQPASSTTEIEDFPSGLQDWSTFYSEAVCFGSSIHVDFVGSDPITNLALRYVLLPIASDDLDDYTTPNAATNNTRATLDALTFQDLMSYPGAQSGYVRHPGAGSSSVKAFRKTKHMLGIKDVIDNQQSLTMNLPTAADPNSGRNTISSNVDPTLWLWYFRVLPYSTAVQQDIMYTFRLKYYLQLQTRRLITQLTTVSA